MKNLVQDNKIMISDIIANLDESNVRPYCDLSKLDDELNTGQSFSYFEEAGEHLKQVVINEWICSDTPVGVYAYFLDGEFVAISTQQARKADVSWLWNSKQSAINVRNFILSLYDNEELLPRLETIGPDASLHASWLEKGPLNDPEPKAENFKRVFEKNAR